MGVPTFVMMCCLVGSGKTVKAQELAKQYDATVFSSDSLREELFGDVNEQSRNQELFTELHKRIKDCLRKGKSAIYDATNIDYKKRMSFLAELKKIPCEKICVLMATPYEECLKRNAERERKVPTYVIERMYRNFDVPWYYEGFDDIQVEYGEYNIERVAHQQRFDTTMVANALHNVTCHFCVKIAKRQFHEFGQEV